MDPLEVGVKTLAGIIENRAVIFTHPEFADDFTEIYADPRGGIAARGGPGGSGAYRAPAARGQSRRGRRARSSASPT